MWGRPTKPRDEIAEEAERQDQNETIAIKNEKSEFIGNKDHANTVG
jgi:hypothetical protein